MLARLGQRWLSAFQIFHTSWLVRATLSRCSLIACPPAAAGEAVCCGLRGNTQQREYWTWAEGDYRPLTSVEMKLSTH